MSAKTALLIFVTTACALTFTSPTSSTIDPTQPITVTWTSSSNDPATFDLVLDQPGMSGSLFSNVPLGSNIATSAGSYTIPANTALAYGDSFVIEAVSNGGAIGQTGSFGLSATTPDSQSSQGSNGASATESAGSASSMGSVTGSVTEVAATGSATTGSAMASVSAMTSSGSMTTSTRSGTSTASSTSSSASATSSTNAQARLELGAGQIVMCLAGALAGVAALCA